MDEFTHPDIRVRAIAGKPERWIVELVCRRFGCEPAEVVMVGDRLGTDVRFANAFGMRSILVLNGERRPASFDGAKPDAVAETIAQVADEFWPANMGWT